MARGSALERRPLFLRPPCLSDNTLRGYSRREYRERLVRACERTGLAGGVRRWL